MPILHQFVIRSKSRAEICFTRMLIFLDVDVIRDDVLLACFRVKMLCDAFSVTRRVRSAPSTRKNSRAGYLAQRFRADRCVPFVTSLNESRAYIANTRAALSDFASLFIREY